MDFNSIKFQDQKVSDFSLSFQFNHKETTDKTLICSEELEGKGIFHLFLFGCLTILSSEGKFYSGSECISFIELDLKENFDDFLIWLEQSTEHPIFDNNITVLSNPYFEWSCDNLNHSMDSFSEISKNRIENLNHLNSILQSK